MNILQTVRAVRVAPREGVFVEALPAPAALAQLYPRQSSLDPAWLPPTTQQDTKGLLAVTHNLSLGAAPMLSVAWHAQPEWYRRGYRVELYLNAVEFPPLSNLTPVEQLRHGQLAWEANRDEEQTITLSEGRSFVTLLLIGKRPEGLIGRTVAAQRERWTGSPVKVAAHVRFAVEVPSLALATLRIAQQTAYNEALAQNLAARVQLGAASGDLDVGWHAQRVEADAQRQTEELIAARRGIERAYARERAAIEADESLTPTGRRQQLILLGRMRVETLRSRQLPALDEVSVDEEPSDPFTDGDADIT